MLVLTDPGEVEGRADQRRALASRFARVEAYGLRRDGDGYPIGPSDAALADRRARLESIFREEHRRLAQLPGSLANRSVCALVSDQDGVILSLHDGVSFRDTATRVRLVEGADWSERARGVNAIGTAIAEQTPVAVIGPAHYELRNAGLFCYASPIFDPHGQLVAVLDVTGPMDRHDRGFELVVRTSAMSIERSLRAITYARAGFRNLGAIEHLVTRASAPTILVEPRGPVAIHNEAARRSLLSGRAFVDCETLFGMDFDTLARMAREGGEPRFETRDGSFRVKLDPLLDEGEHPFGIIVHFDPLARAPRAPVKALEPVKNEDLPTPFAEIFATDDAVVQSKQLAAKFAKTRLPMLLLAETGTGKELFARAIHAASECAGGPFIAVNCGAVASTLLESELFGYAPGAFTGAGRRGSDGLLGAANGGTLFLDEIAEMPAPLQASLLRALDDGSYRRLGDSRPRRSAFRLIGATYRDLGTMVEQGDFRSDLFFRLHGACIRIAPLRNRTDRLGLAQALLEKHHPPAPKLARSAVAYLEEHSWPGNVRELRNALAYAVALAGEGPIERHHLPERLVSSGSPTRTRTEVLREAAEEAVRASGGNISDAARKLGVARDTLYRMLKKK
ncbi:sigma 54-interacting transcriptional regulator [Pendulispora rubella]|uniref:Sigma 54-interacting transcriptional regulator n=1 Tax=Pendulispora rubella TaxID=2741070 RepID=A0ABZ2L167_9BACT